MSAHFVKMTAVLILLSLVFASSCQTDASDDSDKLQVYDYYRGTPYKGTVELLGLPSARLRSGYYPWKLYGRIVNGKMAIDFPDVKLELGYQYDIQTLDYVQLQHDQVRIERKNDFYTRFSLHKKGTDMNDMYDYNHVDIYYSTGSYETETWGGNGIQLKAGWNFVEELSNPNWFQGSDEPWIITGLISQNINDFYNKGYRWQLE